MKKFCTMICCICAFSMLCACSDNTDNSSEKLNSSINDGAVDNNETLISRTEEIATDTTEDLDIQSEKTLSFPKADSATIIEIDGVPLDPEDFVEFELDYEWEKRCVDTWDNLGSFLDSLDNPEFKDLYCKALALVRLVSTDNLKPADTIDLKNHASMDRNDPDSQIKGTYFESGYTYDSFYKAYFDVFTQETADIVFSRYSAFCSYNGELWYKMLSGTGNPWEVYQEYEILNETDTVFEFRRISYNVDNNEEIGQYDPAKKDEYEKEYINFKFILTTDGWRVEEFLNATNLDEPMLFF